MKRKLGIAGVILVIAIAVFALLIHRQDPPVIVHGTLAPKDLAEIKMVALRWNRKEFLDVILRKPSISQIKRIPGLVGGYLQHRLREVNVIGDTEVCAVCLTKMNNSYSFVYLSKGTNGWSIDKGGHFYPSEQLLRP